MAGLDICHSAYLDVVYSHVEMVDYRDITPLDLPNDLLAERVQGLLAVATCHQLRRRKD